MALPIELFVTDAAGNPINGARVFHYEAGTFSAKAVFTTSALDVAYPQGFSLPNGRGVYFLGEGAYRRRVTTADGVDLPAYALDNVQAPTDNGGTLRTELTANTADAGAGLVAFNHAAAYAADTVGWALRQDFASGVNPLRWLPPNEWAAVLNGTSTFDCTTALQSAINHASNNGLPPVCVPSGIWRYTRLYTYYDATLNPGFNSTKMARVRLIGAGRLQHAEANGWPGEGWHGTVLLSTATTGDCFNMSPASANGGFYPARENALENITLIGNTPGFVVRHHCAISSQMRNVTILQLNAAGSGVYWHSAWFTNWDTVWITNTATSGQTGVGVDFGATIFAGSFRFTNCVFERFRDGFQINDSVQSVSMLFDGICTFQSNARDGLQINAPMRSLVLDTPYIEFNGRSHVRCALTTGGVQSLAIRGGFSLGGTSSATSMTGPMIHLRNVTNWSVDGLAVFRPWTDIVDVEWYAANGTAGAIKNVCVDASDNTPGGVIYLAKVNDQRAMPTLEGNNLIGSSQVREYDAASYFVNTKHGLLGFESMAWQQPVQRLTMGLNATTFLQSGTTAPLVVFNITGGGSFVALPGSPGTGRYIVIANQASSVASTLVRQPNGSTNLATLTAGQAVLCYFEPTAGLWVAVGPLAFAGV